MEKVLQGFPDSYSTKFHAIFLTNFVLQDNETDYVETEEYKTAQQIFNDASAVVSV